MMDLLVGMAISIMALLAMATALQVGVTNKRVISEVLDAETSANMAMGQLESEIKSAGYGIATAPIVGCNLKFWRGGAWVTTQLNPIEIGVGAGGNGSDTITVAKARGDTGYASSKVLIAHAANDGTDYQSANRYNFNVNDVLLLSDGGSSCTTIGVTSLPGDGLSITWGGANAVNSPSGAAFATTTAASMSSLGPLGVSKKVYGIDATTGSKLMRTDVMAGTAAADMGDQVVYMKAMFGKDPTSVMKITSWDTAAPTTAADWAKVLGIRVAIVTRSQAHEPQSVVGFGCAATDTSCTIKMWPDETAVAVLPTTPTYTVSGDAVHYRHVLRTMVIPLRNIIWNNN